MATPFYKKIYTARDIATTTKATWVTAIVFDITVDFPPECLADSGGTFFHFDILDVFKDNTGLATDGTGRHNSAWFHAAIIRVTGGVLTGGYTVDEVSRAGNDFGTLGDNQVRLLPSSVGLSDTITIQVESPTGNNDGVHFVVAEVTAYNDA